MDGPILVILIFGNSVFVDHTSKLVKFALIFGKFLILWRSKSEDVLNSLSKNYKLLRDKKTSIKKQTTLDSFFQKS